MYSTLTIIKKKSFAQSKPNTSCKNNSNYTFEIKTCKSLIYKKDALLNTQMYLPVLQIVITEI